METKYLVVVAILIIGYLYIESADVRRLNADGWVLYHSPTCSYCVKQFESLGWQQYLISSVDCTVETGKASTAGVSSYPTWVNARTGSKHAGYVPRESLAEVLSN
jgi:hypothetical protein